LRQVCAVNKVGQLKKNKDCHRPGLPDGLFSNQKYHDGGLAMESFGIFYDHLVYFTAIGNMLWPFGAFCGHLVYFPRFGTLYEEKSGNRATDRYLRALK
jgi:hypothetical protein